MANSFDYGRINIVEFGVCVDTDEGEKHFLIPIDENVKSALKEMLIATRKALGLTEPNARLATYQPSEKYSSVEQLKIALNNEMNGKLREFYDSTNIPTDPTALTDPSSLVYYFAAFFDNNGIKLLAVKRATQFRGIVKSGNLLIRIIDETLKILEDKIFKLDQEFDYYITHDTIYILRPSAFEFTADIEANILSKAAEHALDLSNTLPFLDCGGLAHYVSGHKRAARILASIRSRSDLARTSLTKLKRECRANNINIKQHNGKIFPESGHELDFLQMLDRRRFNVALTDDGLEFYEATGRRNIG